MKYAADITPKKLMEIEYIVFHGTDNKCFTSILENGFDYSFKRSNWMGWGVYFFEDHEQHAINWCEKVKGFNNYIVLKCTITVNKDYLMDFTNPRDYDKYVLAKKKLIELTKDKNRYKNITDVFVLDYLARKRSLKLVRQAYATPPWKMIYRTTVIPTQIQLCVKEKACINRDTIMIEVERNE